MKSQNNERGGKKQLSERPMHRREILRSVGTAGGVSALGFSGLSSATTQNSDGKASHLSGAEEKQAVSKAISHSDSRTLIPYMAKKGFELKRSEGSAVYLNPEGVAPCTFVSIQFEKKSGLASKAVSLLWTDHPTEGGSTVVVLNSGTTIQYDVEDEEVIKETSESSAFTGDASISAESDDCSYFEERCTDPNWTCIASAFVAYASCSYALVKRDIGGFLLCLAGGGVSFAQVIDDEGCNPCDSTTLVEVNLCRFPDTGTCCGPGSP